MIQRSIFSSRTSAQNTILIRSQPPTAHTQLDTSSTASPQLRGIRLVGQPVDRPSPVTTRFHIKASFSLQSCGFSFFRSSWVFFHPLRLNSTKKRKENYKIKRGKMPVSMIPLNLRVFFFFFVFILAINLIFLHEIVRCVNCDLF